jgi:HPt (histidine-containing phosphotransfer) domain-containing protein
VLKLVKSFASSLEGILEKLALSNIDKNITHNIAGMAGNLRFYKLAKLSIELEKDIDTWSETIHKEKKIILVDFLKDILNQISLLEK